jgi:hypothetical protein
MVSFLQAEPLMLLLVDKFSFRCICFGCCLADEDSNKNNQEAKESTEDLVVKVL